MPLLSAIHQHYAWPDPFSFKAWKVYVVDISVELSAQIGNFTPLLYLCIQYIHCKKPTLVSQPIPQPPSADTHTEPDNDIMGFFSDDKPSPWCLPREY
jgi:hypothetical protein